MKTYNKSDYLKFLQHAVLKPKQFPWFDFQRTMLFSGNANKQLSNEISEYLNIPLGDISVKTFSDGEVNITVKILS